MVFRLVFQDGDTVPVFPVSDAGVNLMMVPFAKDADESLHAVATACSVFLPGHDDVREMSLGLAIKNVVTGESYDYSTSEALERLPSELWLPYCVSTSFALMRLVSLEMPEKFHIYAPSYRRDSQIGTLLGVLASELKEHYQLRRVDEWYGSVLWIGLKNER